MAPYLDAINSLFLLAAVVASGRDVLLLYRCKSLSGVGLSSLLLLAAWPAWDALYYWGLGQPLSFCLGLVLLVLRVAWLGLAWRYRPGVAR